MWWDARGMGGMVGRVAMSISELLQGAQFLVDAKGNKKAVVFDYALWEALLTLLEDVEDAEEIRRLREAGGETVPWDQAKVELRTQGADV
jgi:hypothetical protein